MKVKHIDHIGVAVKSIEQAGKFYTDILGLRIEEIARGIASVAQAVPGPALHQPVAIGGIAQIVIYGRQEVIEACVHEIPHHLIRKTVVCGHQDAILRYDERFIPLILFHHPAAEVNDLLLEYIQVTVILDLVENALRIWYARRNVNSP